MKQKLTVNKIFNYIIIILGMVYIIYPWFGSAKPISLFYFFLGTYSGLKFVEYLFQKEKTDRENLYTTITSILIPLLNFIDFPNDSMLLPLSILTWVCLMSIVKLIKLDYLHDRRLPMFKVKVVTFIIFIIVGVMTSYSLYFEPKVQTIIIGFFIVINGIIDFSQNMIKSTIKKPSPFKLKIFKKSK